MAKFFYSGETINELSLSIKAINHQDISFVYYEEDKDIPNIIDNNTDIKNIECSIRLKELTPYKTYNVIATKEDNVICQSSFEFLGESNTEIAERLGYKDNEEIQRLLIKLKGKGSFTDLGIKKNKKDANKGISALFYSYISLRNPKYKELYQEFIDNIIDNCNYRANVFDLDDSEDFVLSQKNPNLSITNLNYVEDNDYSIKIYSYDNPKEILVDTIFNKNIFTLKLPEGYYIVEIYTDSGHSLIRRYGYISFGEENSNNKYKVLQELKEKMARELVNSKYYLETDYSFNNETEEHILSVLASQEKFIQNYLSPAPEVFFRKKDLIVRTSVNLKPIMGGWNIDKSNLYISACEEDQLFNPNRKCRKKKILDSDFSEDSNSFETIFNANFNPERYYFWLENREGKRFSPISTFDITQENIIDYNEIYSKTCWKKFVNNFPKVINTKTKVYEKLKSLIDNITIFENLAYSDPYKVLMEKIIDRYGFNDDIIDMIIAVKACFLLYRSNYDFDILQELDYKVNYNSLIFKIENPESVILMHECIDLSKDNKYSYIIKEYDDTNNAIEYQYEIYGKNSIHIINMIDKYTLKESDFVLIYRKPGEKIPRLFSSKIKIDTIYGL